MARVLRTASLLLLVYVPGALSAACAAEVLDRSGVWFGIGIEGIGEVDGFGMNLQCGYYSRHVLVGGRVVFARELALDLWGSGETQRELVEIGPVVGMRYRWHILETVVATGISYAGGTWYDESAYLDRSALGVPVECSILLAPSDTFGLGINAFQNFNGVRSYGGGGVVVTLRN